MKAAMIALEASTLIAGRRAEQHGDIKEMFGAAAKLWNALLAARQDPNAPISPSDVAKLMALFKLARTESGEHNVDDFIDMAGYAAIAGELEGAGL